MLPHSLFFILDQTGLKQFLMLYHITKMNSQNAPKALNSEIIKDHDGIPIDEI